IQGRVTVRGVGTTAASYRTPPLPAPEPAPPYKPSIGSRILNSEITMIVLALLAASVIALLVIGFLQPKRSGLPARMAEFVSIRGLQRDNKTPASTDSDEEAAPTQPDFWTRFEETLEIAEINV